LSALQHFSLCAKALADLLTSRLQDGVLTRACLQNARVGTLLT
jgi:hypothetical protein